MQERDTEMRLQINRMEKIFRIKVFSKTTKYNVGLKVLRILEKVRDEFKREERI